MRVLLDVLDKLVDRGNTVIVIEHNLDVVKMADYVIDLGKEGGRAGGNVFFQDHRKNLQNARKLYREIS